VARPGRFGGRPADVRLRTVAKPLLHSHPIRAVLFDLDGVLANTLPVMQLAYAASLEALDIEDPPFSSFVSWLGLPLDEIARKLGLPVEFVSHYREARRQHEGIVTLQFGVEGLLHQLGSADILMGVVTGKDGDSARRLLTSLGVLDRFTAVVGSDEVSHPKPAADPALVALTLISSQRPAERLVAASTLLIGDAVVDLRCGREAGCVVGAALWGYGDPGELMSVDPDLVFESPGDVSSFITSEPAARSTDP